MTKLPEKNVLSGTKTPKTTTGEMKNALGKLRDYLAELFGDDSQNKEVARQSLGIDLSALATRPDLESALSEKADKTELAGKADRDAVRTLKEAIAKLGVPVGSIGYFAMGTPPAGYLKADGSEVERQTYPDLFMAIGTTFGEGDGKSTFNLPDLMGRFAQGSDTPGQKLEAGLPNIDGSFGGKAAGNIIPSGAFFGIGNIGGGSADNTAPGYENIGFDASRSTPIYGASDTVQPAALTLLPCIKAFDPVTNPGLID